MQNKTKAKRRLFGFDFSKEGAAVHLVGVNQGGAANGFEVLVTKSTNALPDVDDKDMVLVSKALEQITVTMSMEQFLRKFFDMWSDDAELLTKLLGYETEYENYLKENKENESYDHGKWLEERVSQFSIMKSMNDGSLEKITKSALIDTLALQDTFEKALEGYNIKLKELEMTEVEIAKAAQLDAEQKLADSLKNNEALQEQITALQEEVNVFKQAKVEGELSAIRDEIKDFVGEDKLETVVKSLHGMEKDAAEALIAVMKSAKVAAVAAVENSDLTEEIGQGEETDVQKAKHAAALAFLTEQASL